MAVEDILHGRSSPKTDSRVDKRGPQEIHSKAKARDRSTPVLQIVHCVPPLLPFPLFQIEVFMVVILFPPHKYTLFVGDDYMYHFTIGF